MIILQTKLTSPPLKDESNPISLSCGEGARRAGEVWRCLGRLLFFTILFLLSACNEKTPWKPDPGEEEPTPPVVTPGENPFKAPLYWSVYEYCFTVDGGIPEFEWEKNIDWVEKNLLPYGYDMICIDGWGDVVTDPVTGYRTNHSFEWKNDYAWWSKELRKRGMRLGIYDNPLWINGNRDIIVEGTNVRLRDLVDPDAGDLWFSWLNVDRKGAKEYIEGFFKHYAKMDVDYIRIDFLSWYENGYDRGIGTVGKGYGRENYELALKYIYESASKYNIFISLVMPHNYEDAVLESQYGHMMRINADCLTGGWWRFSDVERGEYFENWPQYSNPFDGFIHWSRLSGREKIILDGDFIRLNTFESDYEKESCVSLNLMAGGPVTVSDQYNTIGNNLKFYTNDEMLQLNKDGFVGKPLSHDPKNNDSQIWYGQMSNGDWIVGLFNRENTPQVRSILFSRLGIDGTMQVRDLWKHTDLGEKNQLMVTLEPHACLIVKLTKSE